METRHRKQSLERLETETEYNAGFPPEVVRAFRLRMNFIREADDERDLRARKAYCFKKLGGTRRGQYSIRLNDQWRLIVEIVGRCPNKIVMVVDITDYH
ncbi:MAG: type II toxin-antitoxin system RelE/ParE family toxin [Candidatus Eisenbacteria bacterium]